ncbi:MAG: Stp1/IreP family PP2C-type Ser/Thr phosphatase [Chloroflexia bacterium]
MEPREDTMSLTVFVRERTDPGLVRKQNQDFHGYHQPPLGSSLYEAKGELYVVADGMGGGAAGDLAGQWAVQKVIYEYYNDPDPTHDPAASLRRAIEEANYELYVNATTDPSRKDMGSTIVAAVVWGNLLIVANVGDSRAYLIRDGRIFRLTEDHSWVAEAVKKGLLTPEEAVNHPNRNVLTRNLGGRPDVEVDICNYPLQPGDTVILCTDGLHGVVSDVEIAQIASQPDLSRAPSSLIALANERGGPDNITVTMLHLCDEEEARRLKRMSDTRPIEPVPPGPLERFTPIRAAPSGLLGELVEFFRLYPTLSAIAFAFLLGLLTLALVLALLAREGGEEGRGTATATLPTTSPLAVLEVPTTPSPPPPVPPSPTHPPYGYLAYITAEDHRLRVARVEKDANGPYLTASVPLSSTLSAFHPSWFPDGDWLIFQASPTQDQDGVFYIVPWDGQGFGQPQPLQDAQGQPLQGRYPAVSPDGTRLAYRAKDDKAIWTCTLDLNKVRSTYPQQVTNPCPSRTGQNPPPCRRDYYPAWSPDKKKPRIVFARLSGGDEIRPTLITDLIDILTVTVPVSPGLSGTEEFLSYTDAWECYPTWGDGGIAWSTWSEQDFKLSTNMGRSCPNAGVEPAWGPYPWLVFVFRKPDQSGSSPPANWELRFLNVGNCECRCANGKPCDDCQLWPGMNPAWWWPKEGSQK